MRWGPASPALLGVLAAALVVGGCRNAAVVFFDLPPQWAAPDSVGRQAADSAAARAARRWPALEQVDDAGGALDILPRDAKGHVDWVRAEQDSLIRPRWGIRATTPAPGGTGWDHDVAFPTGTVFPHRAHTEWLTCEACHGDFRELRTAPARTPLEHAAECAACHGPVAFPVQSCGRCHASRADEGGQPVTPLPGDIRMARLGSDGETRTYGLTGNPRAVFRHWVHRARYRCSVCHPGPFPMESGSTRVTHAAIERGEACGQCHDDRVAFGLGACDRCHAAPAPGEREGPG